MITVRFPSGFSVQYNDLGKTYQVPALKEVVVIR